MAQIYGSQGDTIAESSFVWASKITFNLLGTTANTSGVVKIGHFTVSSLYDRDSTTNISLQDLNKAVDTQIPLKKTSKFTLTSAIVNHSIANSLNKSVVASGHAEEFDLGAEIIAFAIVEKPFTDLSTGNAQNYSMDYQVDSNYVAMPKLWDSFSNSLPLAAEVDLRRNYVWGRKRQ